MEEIAEGRKARSYVLSTSNSPHPQPPPSARRVTNETYRWLSDPRFHPSESKIVATKWYTSSRSLGAGEGWVYPVPSLPYDLSLASHEWEEASHVPEGSGERVVERALPLGWGPEDYGEQQIGPEQILWRSNDVLIYSKNVIDESEFAYSKGWLLPQPISQFCR